MFVSCFVLKISQACLISNQIYSVRHKKNSLSIFQISIQFNYIYVVQCLVTYWPTYADSNISVIRNIG